MTETTPLPDHAPIVLASGSAIRRRVLEDARVPFTAVRPDVDEGVIKDEMRARGESVDAIAAVLAETKATTVSAKTSGVVIGADQILSVDDALFDKPKDMAEARDRLWMLRGREHELVGAVAIARNGEVRHRLTQRTRLKVREFSEGFLDAYIAEEGDAILASVGCYRFEGMGAQLFERIDGDYFAILGLPLLPVLDLLRKEGALQP